MKKLLLINNTITNKKIFNYFIFLQNIATYYDIHQVLH